jgi:hypothetical protein
MRRTDGRAADVGHWGGVPGGRQHDKLLYHH